MRKCHAPVFKLLPAQFGAKPRTERGISNIHLCRFFTRQTLDEYTKLVIFLTSLGVAIGILLVLLSVDIFDTLSGREWEEEVKEMLRIRALRYYVFSWYCVVFPVLLFTSLVNSWITFIGYIMFVLVVPRYYFFKNLPFSSF